MTLYIMLALSILLVAFLVWCCLRMARVSGSSNDMTEREMVQYIAEYYGISSQLAKLVEECGELTTAAVYACDSYDEGGGISRDEHDELVDEMADVLVMIMQIIHLADCGDEVLDRIRFKLERQIGRIRDDLSRV